MRKSLAVVFGLLLAGGTVWAQQYLITTVAGFGYKGGLPPMPAQATSVSTMCANGLAGRRPPACSTIRHLWRWTPPATSTSQTISTT